MTGAELLPQLVARCAATAPNSTFLQLIHGPELSYSQTQRGIQFWAERLASIGVGKGTVVAIMLPNCLESILAWLATTSLGGHEVPVNPDLRGRTLTHVLADSAAQVIVTNAQLAAQLRRVTCDLPNLAIAVLADRDGEDLLTHVRRQLSTDIEVMAVSGLPVKPDPLLAPPEPWDTCSIMYTSGTTGRAKGVLVPWGQLHATAISQPLDVLDSSDRWYSPLPLFHVSGKTAIYMAALVGGSVVIRDRFSTSHFWHDIKTFKCTMTFLVSSMYQFLLSQPEHPDDADSPLKRVGMAPLPVDIDVFATRFGVDICTSYNSTELSCPITSDGFSAHRMPHGTAGRVRSGYECRVVDDFDRPLPSGKIGELIVRAAEPWTLMAGYLRSAELTTNAWRNGWFHTGDAFTYDDDGYYYFKDRRKDTIRRRGENISSLEVEAEFNSHPDVVESAAIPVPSEHGDDEIKVFVVRNQASAVSEQDLVEFLRPRVPRFMIPKYIEFCTDLPKTPTMKVRKDELAKRPLTPAL